MAKKQDKTEVKAVAKLDQISSKKLPHSPIEIVQEGHPTLRQKTEAVALGEITSPKIQKIIADMKSALDSQDDGVGLAAPQIGHPLSIFIISKTALERIEEVKNEAKKKFADAGEVMSDPDEIKNVGAGKKKAKFKDLIFINPRMIKLSKEKDWLDEGCLSVRWLYGKVRRSLRATIGAYDADGKYFERGAGGTLAHIFQHEMDHLDGTLFIDKAVDLEEIEPENENK